MFESRVIAVMSGMVGLSLWLAGVEPVAGGVTTRVTPGGDAIELEIPTEVGTQKETLPLYHSGKIHYFSGGGGRASPEQGCDGADGSPGAGDGPLALYRCAGWCLRGGGHAGRPDTTGEGDSRPARTCHHAACSLGRGPESCPACAGRVMG